MSTPTRMDKATKEDLRAEIAELRRVGSDMFDICFFWRRSDEALPQGARVALEKILITWREIKRREPR